ncbi:hypothetical protein A9F13_07g03740 [Clavispora lusitaniae]|uniref:Uncharacterized protein n=1 Tax=Clavispora lusitaniae TaxID=36911 RepID=A0AA91T295_CLALS|nr:hypothetical protein A9F13_07g03740 [Clavispora lusitaniae]
MALETRKDRAQKLLSNRKPVTESTAWSLAQETYSKRLEGDIERTKKFLEQAQAANTKLERELSNEPLDEESEDLVNLLGLFEVYKSLPYMPMKNDSIGIATAASLTKNAVLEQSKAISMIRDENEATKTEIQRLENILADYAEFGELLQARVQQHPARMEELEQQLHGSRSLETELEHQIEFGQKSVDQLKKVEDKMYQHVKRVVTKLHALLDWENASMMDEDMFKESLRRSIALINRMIKSLVSQGTKQTKWVQVPAGPEEKLVQVMLRNNLIHVRNGNGLEIRLREFGFD